MATESRFIAALAIISFSINTVTAQNCASCSVVGRFCYTFNNNIVTNAVAVTQCANAGGRLPFFATAQDVTDFANYATNVSLGQSWLGFWNYNPHSVANPGNWTDQQGNVETYTNWSPVEPNNQGGVESCAQTYPYGQWNDIPCTNSFQVVCQCQCPMPSNPFVKISGGAPPAINAVITLSCASCYQLNGLSTATCLHNGTTMGWNVDILSSNCSRIQCPALFTGSEGTYSAGPYYACSSYMYNCIANYVVEQRNTASDNYTCLANGTWDKIFIPCVVITTTTSTTTTSQTTTSTTTTSASTTTTASPTTTTTSTTTSSPTTTSTSTTTSSPTTTSTSTTTSSPTTTSTSTTTSSPTTTSTSTTSSSPTTTTTSITMAQNCATCSVYGRFCYSLNNTPVNNAAAITQCANSGGRLSFFPLAQDVTDFSNYAASISLTTVWLGYWNYNPHSASNPGNWTDLQGNVGMYTRWAAGQPDDYVGSEKCGVTYQVTSWNDMSCMNNLPVLCQCACITPSSPNMIASVTSGVPPAISYDISLSCDTCYQLSGPSSATCAYNGTTVAWDTNIQSSSCSRVQCPALFTGTTGTYSAGPYYSCTSYVYSCIPSYIVDQRDIASENYTCLADGTWDKIFIPCVVTSTTSTTTTSVTTTTPSPTTTTPTPTTTTPSPITTTPTPTTTTPSPTTTSTSTTTPSVTASTQNQKTTIWSQNFTNGVAPTACQCQTWVDFWKFWIGDPSQVASITLAGSLTSTTYTCSGAPAQFIAFALGTPPFEATQVTCESGIWFTGLYPGYPTGNAVGVLSPTTSCSNNPCIRPCWINPDWGGVGTYNCMAPSQTFTVTVVSNIPTVTIPPASVTWTDSFTNAIPATSAQCYNWKQFWQNTVPRGNSLSVTLTSSVNGGVSATCSGPGVNLLATALFTPTSSGQYHCNEGTVWYFNGIWAAYPSTSAIQIGGSPLVCTGQLSLRPCWDQPVTDDWGGFGGANCHAPSQTFTVTVTIAANTISNACWQQLNIEIATGKFIISCNSVMLQCNTNYMASGYEPGASGFYTCSNAVWSPSLPSCIAVTTTSTTTTTSSSTATPTTTSTITTTPTQTTSTSSTTTTTTPTTSTTSTTTTSTTPPTTSTTATLTKTTSTATPTTTNPTTTTTSPTIIETATTTSTSTTTPYLTTTSASTTTATITPTSITTCVTTTTYTTSLAQDSGSGMFSSNFTTLPVSDLTAFLTGTNYSKSDYPRSHNDVPTGINVSVQIAKLSSVSESSSTFDVDLSVTLAWVDHRLNYAKLNGSMTSGTFQLTNTKDQDLLWLPTLFVVNAQGILTPKVLLKNTVSFIQSDGTVILQQRVLATASCQMKLSNYPFDTQNCFIKFSLYGYFVSQLTLNWKYPTALEQSGRTNSTPLAVPPDFSLPNFDIQKIVIGTKRDNISQDVYCGKYRPCLIVQFTLGRKVSYHVLRTYLPSTFVLIVSWISFWIHPQNVPARFGLGITTFLTLQTASANTQARLPAISYLTALDVWLLYCQISVLLCLVEFTFVHSLATGLWSYKGVKNCAQFVLNDTLKSGILGLFASNTKSTQTTAGGNVGNKFHSNSTAMETTMPSHNSTDRNYLDFWSRRIFPLSFVLFIIVYFAYYLT